MGEYCKYASVRWRILVSGFGYILWDYLVTIKDLPIFLKYTEIYLKKFNLMESIIEIN